MNDTLNEHKPDDLSTEDLAAIEHNLIAFQRMLNKLDIWEATLCCSLTLKQLLDTLVSRLSPNDNDPMSNQLRAAYEHYLEYDRVLQSKDLN
jgi:hypothetical protein